MRLALVRLSVAAAVAASLLGAVRTWPELGRERSHLSEAEAARAAAVHEELPVELLDRWRARVGAGERYCLEVPEGAAEGLTTRGAVLRTYAVYWLLPALPVASCAEADVVLRLERAP